MNWSRTKVLVTGGASFIGSALVDALVERDAHVRVVDNLTTGRLDNLRTHLASASVEFMEADLLESDVARSAAEGIDVVFHLAAHAPPHVWAGFSRPEAGAAPARSAPASAGAPAEPSRSAQDPSLRSVQASASASASAGPNRSAQASACASTSPGTERSSSASNLALDSLVFRACCDAGVQKVVFASSSSVYPTYRSIHPDDVLCVSEEQAGLPRTVDHLDGWSKLVAELTLQAYYREHRMKAVSCRYFTAYGERSDERHPLIGMIARALAGQDPFVVCGNGQELHNWTYVGDLVEATILAAEKVDDGSAVNVGTLERVRAIDAARAVLRCTGHRAEIALHPQRSPLALTGVADGSLARALLGWRPRTRLAEGLRRTVDWYAATRGVDGARLLMHRSHPSGFDEAGTRESRKVVIH